MGKFDNILILSDIDGTFLDSRGQTVGKNLSSIEYFKKEGGLFSFATGRTHKSISCRVERPESIANAPSIIGNGGCLYDFENGVAVSNFFIDGKRGLEAVKYIRKFFSCEDVQIRISTDFGFLTDRVTGFLVSDFAKNEKNEILELPLDRWNEALFGWFKATFRASPGVLSSVRERFVEKFGNDFDYSRSGDTLFEFQAKGCNKAFMVSELRKYYESLGKIVKIYACGDYENDIPMLKASDVSVCPENAQDEVKKVAKYCLCSCDEGLIYDLIGHIECGDL